MSQCIEFEKRAREAILSKVVEDYQRQQEPALQKTVLMACLCCWQNVVLLGATVLVSSLLLGWIHAMPIIALLVVILLGGVVEGVFLYVGCQNSQRLAAAVVQLHRPRVVFALETLHTKNLRAKLCKALQYWSLIDTMQRNQPEGILRDRLALASQEVTRWLQVVYHLAGQIDEYSCNLVIQRDWRTLPQVIQAYQQKLSHENNPNLQAHLQRTLAYKQQQLQTLGELQNNIERATCQLDSTIASMGVVYSQLLLLVSTRDVESGRINRLQAEISEEVQRLEDLTAAMSELTGYLVQPEGIG